MTDRKFRANDHVFHEPTGETWVLACDQEGDRVIAAGWPETIAKASDCELRKATTDDGRIDMLEKAAKTDGMRGTWAERQLAAT